MFGICIKVILAPWIGWSFFFFSLHNPALERDYLFFTVIIKFLNYLYFASLKKMKGGIEGGFISLLFVYSFFLFWVLEVFHCPTNLGFTDLLHYLYVFYFCSFFMIILLCRFIFTSLIWIDLYQYPHINFLHRSGRYLSILYF